MIFLKKLLRKKENPYYTKLRTSLQRKKVHFKISSAYFLFGLPNREGIVSEIKKAIADNKLNHLKQSESFDVTKDNIELYLLKDIDHNFLLVLLLDYYELFIPEEVIDIIPVHSLDIEKELIFSKQ